jgi:acyl-coenzyme A synthetase/AMP-(fatty) acid ligase
MSVVSLARLFVSGRDPSLPVARCGDSVMSLGTFAADVEAMARRVRGAGARSGAVVAEDGYSFAVGLYGLLHGGARAIVPPNGLADTLAALAPHIDVLVAEPAAASGRPALAIPRGTSGEPVRQDLDPQRAVIAFFTSGSTGAPKQVEKPLWEIDHDLALFDGVWGNGFAGTTTYGTVTHHHFYGLTFRILWPLAGGRPFASEIDEFWEPLLARLVTPAVLVSSPGHLMRLAGVAPLAPPRRLRGVFTGGSALPPAAALDAQALLGCQPTEMYGSTETGPIGMRTLDGSDPPWTPVPGLALSRDEEGCAIVSWPDVPGMRPFETADRIELLPDGRFRLLGRADLIVKIEAKRVSLAEVESALQRLPQVDEAAALALDGVPAQLAAAVVLSPSGRDELEAIGSFRLGRNLRRALAPTLEAAAQPKRWRFVETLPRRALGKRDMAGLKALFRTRDAER